MTAGPVPSMRPPGRTPWAVGGGRTRGSWEWEPEPEGLRGNRGQEPGSAPSLGLRDAIPGRGGKLQESQERVKAKASIIRDREEPRGVCQGVGAEGTKRKGSLPRAPTP